MLPRVFLLLLLQVVPALADSSLLHARRAQALLGGDTWSQVIAIENDAPASVYPARLHALVFELAGILWFYADVNGTQSFSLHRGRLDAEKADFAPLLRAIEPGFARWRVVADKGVVPRGEIPNGCFIESVALLRARIAAGQPAQQPQLLSFYVQDGDGLQGHTVLTFRMRDRVAVIDPLTPKSVARFPGKLAQDPVALARALAWNRVVRARFLALDGLPPLRDPSQLYAGSALPADERGDRPAVRKQG